MEINRINRVRIHNFRRLADISLDMRPVMVLIGVNGIGKSSFLDAFSLLSASASGGLKTKLSDLGGIESILTRGKADEMSLHVEMDAPQRKPLTYNLSLKSQGMGRYAISLERLSQQIKEGQPTPFNHIDSSYSQIKYYEPATRKLVGQTWLHNPYETSLSQVPKMFEEPEKLRRILGAITQYHVLDVGSRAPVKLPQQMKPAELPGADGEDLVPLLYSLRESNKDRYDAIEDTLKSAFPGFESLNFPIVAAGTFAMTWKEKHFKKPLFMNELSEGTLRFLWLVSLLQSPGLSTITMIDEPEVSLHPELLRLLADLMREASKRTQLVVATHSDRLIRFLEPSEVVVMDTDESGLATAKWADTLDLDNWLKDYSLDEVWRMGQMGGRS